MPSVLPPSHDPLKLEAAKLMPCLCGVGHPDKRTTCERCRILAEARQERTELSPEEAHKLLGLLRFEAAECRQAWGNERVNELDTVLRRIASGSPE